MILFGVVVLSLILAVSATDRVCEPIKIETCRDIGYNVTGMPNLVGHELQQDAQLQLQTFTPLIQYGCSSRLKFFLCSVYVPMCTEKVPTPIGPCRSLCEDIRDRCQPVLQEFGFLWPPALNCSKFPPQNNDKHMCMEGPDPKGTDANPRMRNRNRRPIISRNDVTFSDRKLHSKVHMQHYGLCKNFRSSEHYYYINRTQRCAPLCSANIKFTHENKESADYLLAAFSILCFLCTLFNLFVVLFGEYRFRYPEGAIVFISGCYNGCSIAYMIRLLAGRYESSCHMDPQHSAAILIQEGLDNVNCTIIFVILYFFKMAADVWWVILCLTWCLSRRLRWRRDTLNSTYFHMMAWGVPCGLTITALVTRVIDADELVGNCYVGNQSKENLLVYVIIPSAAVLLIGAIFLCVSMFSSGGHKEDKEYSQVQQANLNPKLAVNSEAAASPLAGFFACLYMFPALFVLGANTYEYAYRSSWIAPGDDSQPILWVFILKFIMLQIMGIITSYFIGSSEAAKRAFKKVFRMCSECVLRKKQPVPSYLQVQPHLLNASVRGKRSVSSKTNSETIL